MKRPAIAAVGLALVVGIITGAIIGTPFASAEQSVPKPDHGWEEIGLSEETWRALDIHASVDRQIGRRLTYSN